MVIIFPPTVCLQSSNIFSKLLASFVFNEKIDKNRPKISTEMRRNLTPLFSRAKRVRSARSHSALYRALSLFFVWNVYIVACVTCTYVFLRVIPDPFAIVFLKSLEGSFWDVYECFRRKKKSSITFLLEVLPWCLCRGAQGLLIALPLVNDFV